MYQFSVCFCKEVQYIFTFLFLDFEMNKEIGQKWHMRAKSAHPITDKI